MSKQFDLVRGGLLKFLGEVTEETANKQPQGFNNNILWHAGHVLVAGEKFMFGYPEKTQHLPLEYGKLFSPGTKPADWSGDVPALSELKAQLEAQAARIRELPEDLFAQKLPFQFPFGNLETFGDLYGLMIVHEADHAGQMKAMKRILG
ncbi:DinB family protein [Ectobacillus ponti]|uniref:DinB family protein n=1 Tax=Ectobacillus ponti TaxID=2961894 RepID=A0AA42BRY7_9BACI|nr:DinB family protein [Ectobacillus ponti]MCP8970826.1 DinB family protein [Ectobacillus ponti]